MFSSFWSNLACSWWWVLFGGLLGLLGSWLLGRLFKSAPPLPIERTIEKIVDRPVDRPVDRIVEKIIDNPVHVSRIGELEAAAVAAAAVAATAAKTHQTRIGALESEVATIASLKSRIAQLESAPPKIVEKVVEKIVDRPVDRPVDRIVEKVVDNPTHITRIGALEAAAAVATAAAATAATTFKSRISTLESEVSTISGLKSRIAQLESAPPKIVEKVVEKIVDRPVDRPVDRIVEKVVDNPTHITRIGALEAAAAVATAAAATAATNYKSRIGALESEVATIAGLKSRIATLDTQVATISGLKSRIAELESAPPRIVEKIVEKIVDRPVDRPVDRIVEKTVDNPMHVARIGALESAAAAASVTAAGYQARIATLEAELRRATAPPPIDLVAARAAGFRLKHADDLEIIEGIGPKIAQLCYDAGINTFSTLSKTPPMQLQAILDDGGPNFKLAVPETWPEQAALAANNRWSELATLQQVLNNGQR